jgi:hypothetical protein
MKKNIYQMLILLLLCTIAACKSASINIDHVLIGNNPKSLYTSYNIFYSNKLKISSINYKYANIIPLGTRIKNIEINGSTVSFDIADSFSHVCINYIEKWGKQPIQCFVRQLISNKTQKELLANIPENIKSNIIKGNPLVGMTREQIELTLGPPSFHKTPHKNDTVWTYWSTKRKTFRIIFFNDTVRLIQNM